ncbi:MAG: SPOR domain-containing protein [Candidatus Thermochlorobacter sp.]
MSSTLSVIAKSLAPVLSVPEAKVSEWLQVVMYRVCEELLLSGAAQLSGIGMLRKVHIPSRPVEQEGVIFVTPPRYSVELMPEPDDSNGGLLYDVALESFSLEDDLAEKFSAGFATAVRKTLEFKNRVELEPLGVIVQNEKNIALEPSEWLLDLLNKPYQNLAPIPLTKKSSAQTPQSSARSAKPELSQQETSQTEHRAETAKPTQTTAASSSAPPTPQVAPTEFNPADFGLDNIPVEKQDEEKIFLEQSGFRAELGTKRSKTEKRKTTFQPPIPLSLDEVESLAIDTQRAQVRSFLENQDIPPTGQASTETAAEAAPPLRVPKEGVSKSAIFTLVGVSVAVLLITSVFFWVSRSRTPASSSTSSSTMPIPVAKSEVEKSSSQQVAEKGATNSDNTAPLKQNSAAENLIAKPSGSSSSSKPVSAPAVEQKSVKPNSEQLVSSAKSALPPELSTPVIEAKGGWAIVVASRPTEAEAREVANTFAQKGFNVSIKPRTVNGELRYRVRIGQFAQQSDALKAIKQYSSQLPKGAFLDKVQ